MNFTIADPKAAIKRIQAQYAKVAKEITYADGLSMDLSAWRLNLRPSGTEPLVRLNIESRDDADLVQEKLAEVRHLLGGAST